MCNGKELVSHGGCFLNCLHGYQWLVAVEAEIAFNTTTNTAYSQKRVYLPVELTHIAQRQLL